VLYPSGLANPDLKWESNKKLDAALELGFLKDRISLTADYYHNRSGNQLLYIGIPGQTGFGSYVGNFPAVVQNSGLELDLTTINLRRADLEWTTSINFTLPKNKLVSFPGLTSNPNYSNSYIIGQPVNLTKLYHYLGINSADGTINLESTDYSKRIPAPVGNPYYGGINNNISYKGFQLSFFFQFSHQMGRTDYQYAPSPIGAMYNQSTAALDRWQQKGDNALFPKATTTYGTVGANTYYFLSSTAFWGDASFVRLKTASLSYNLPALVTKKLRLSACSIYVQGQNLYTWAKQKYVLDPETTLPGTGPGLGTGVMVVPPLRTIVAGIHCSL
jgi:hypothetical protein